jgi:hypothetical protein
MNRALAPMGCRTLNTCMDAGDVIEILISGRAAWLPVGQWERSRAAG